MRNLLSQPPIALAKLQYSPIPCPHLLFNYGATIRRARIPLLILADFASWGGAFHDFLLAQVSNPVRYAEILHADDLGLDGGLYSLSSVTWILLAVKVTSLQHIDICQPWVA